MRRSLILAPLLLASCTHALTRQVCETSLRAGATAQDLIPILVRDWDLSEEKAAAWALGIFAGTSTVGAFCAAVRGPGG